MNETIKTYACIADFYGHRLEYYLCVDLYEVWWTECPENVTRDINDDVKLESALWKLKNPTEPYLVQITRSTTVEKI